MKKRKTTREYRPSISDFRGLRLPALCVFFALGAVLGHITAHLLGGDSDLALLLQSVAATETDNIMSTSALAVIGTYFRFPLAVLLLGQCTFAVVAIPLLLAAQGFIFSFSVATLVVSLGRRAVLLALVTLGLQGLVIIFVTLLLALGVLQRGTNSDCREKIAGSPIFIGLSLLTAGVILELTAVPKLFSLALVRLN